VSGSGIKVSVDDLGARAMLDRMLAFGGAPLRRFFQSSGNLLANSAKRRFITQHAPDGSTWKPSLRVLEHGGQTLRLHGFLQRSIISEPPSSDGVVIGSPLVYAGVHNDGRTVTIFPRSQQIYRGVSKAGVITGFVKKAKAAIASWVTIPGYTIHMPKRTFLGIDNEDARQLGGLAVLEGQRTIDGTGGAA